ncbi:Fe-S cluster assembly protein SufB [archaeon CG10_big_fil_rev_8_21_14_0_10_43_11]|nr:MAG: Fe-S cluster assembly protein SufB [archaeon CG10_big_fil_rev_8_21_14_0_10_43_11]
MNEKTLALKHLNDDYKERYGFSKPDASVFKTKRGLNRAVVNTISKTKQEPEWMREFRLNALTIFNEKPMPTWGADLSNINFDDITYYLKPGSLAHNWNDVPKEIKDTFERLGVPESERKFFGGVGAQYDSETVYHNLREDLKKKGVVFLDTETGLKEYPELFKKYFGTVIPAGDNKFAALNSATWSGGTFIYVPKGVKVGVPLQAYFRINADRMGQFERTLIIADEGAEVHYIEGCTAPVYSKDSLHAAVVEIIALKGSKVRYTTVQNWSGNVYNLVTKRAVAHEDAVVEWIDGNLGSKITMKYPSVYLKGERARGEILSVAYAGKGQHQDAGGKVVHLAKNTTSRVVSKSISNKGGRASYRGLVYVAPHADNVSCNVQCDALLLDEASRSDTYPTMKINNDTATITHEASVGNVGKEQLFYIMSRGFSESEAIALIVLGFINDFTKALPMDYAVELKRLIAHEMEGSIG